MVVGDSVRDLALEIDHIKREWSGILWTFIIEPDCLHIRASLAGADRHQAHKIQWGDYFLAKTDGRRATDVCRDIALRFLRK